jgi:exonuclease SbcC
MILKSLEIENIKSYKTQRIDFPTGTILFEGDVGSGKSTILNSIEFALFGLGSQRGGSLLRLGTKKGFATLTFETDGKKYIIHRSLVKKGNHVRQGDDGYIEAEGRRIPLSATELKERILDILNFNEPPDPKAQSVIFQYAIYTPQEEMKMILTQKPDMRLQTLRKAFGIEEYKIASENTQETSRIVRKRSDFFEGQISDLNQKEESLNETRSLMSTFKEELAKFEGGEKALDKELLKIKAELSEYQETRQEIERIKAQIPHYEKEIREKSDLIEKTKEENKDFEEKIKKEQPAVKKFSEMVCPTKRSETEIKKDLEKAREDEKEIRRKDAQTELKIREYESIKENEICPTCDRPADPREFEHKIAVVTRIKEETEKKKRDQEELVKKLEELQLELREYISAQKEMEGLKKQIEDWNTSITRNNKNIKTLNEDVSETKTKLEDARKETEKLEAVSKKIDEIKASQERAEKDLISLRENINIKRGRIETLRNNIKTLLDEITQKKEQRKKRDTLVEHQIWLSDYFLPTLDIIEKQVLISINREFGKQFQRFFSTMIEDPDLTVNIDEDFTPRIEREGYDQDVQSLSGGEKTSLALAYRLALNTIVQEVSAGMKSNLLILDEPTDGFSKEQLFKMRDILDEIKCPQVIMVSHEKELENFADQIFQLTKSGGVSHLNFMR